MTPFKVNITQEALQDMEDLYDYIANDLCSKENAMKQYNRIADAILELKYFPERYEAFDVEPEKTLGLRRMIVDKYLVCYVVDSNTVTVTDVLYCASNVHTRLLRRHR